jgi:NADPH-dependent curcumin reductase CurA
MIWLYNATESVPGPANLPLVISRRLRIQGFIATDHAAKAKEMASDFTEWHRSGQLKYRVDIVRGLDAAPWRLTNHSMVPTVANSWFK